MLSEKRVRLLSKIEYIRYLKNDERRSSKSASASRLQDVKVQDAEMRMTENAGS
jgi:hypothetical protein